MAVEPDAFDTPTSGRREPEPQDAEKSEDKLAGIRKWMAYLWIPLAAVVLVQISVCTSLNQQLDSARDQVSGLQQEVSSLQSENQQLKDQVKVNTHRAKPSLEFSEVQVGKSADSLEDTSAEVHLEHSGLETIYFEALGPSAFEDATAYGNISIELVQPDLVQPDGESCSAGEVAIQNGDPNVWLVEGSCSREGFAAGKWEIHLSYHGRTVSRTFYVD